MNLITKIRQLIKDAFSSKKSEEVNVEQAISDWEQQKFKLQNALTQLYFQQGKLEDKKNQFEKQAGDLAADLELAVQNGRDDLALHLLEKTDDIKEQVTFINSQLAQIVKDIEMAKTTQKELELGSVKFKSSLEAFQTRKNLLEAQKTIKEQLSSVKSDISSNVVNKLNDKIHLLNAQIKSLENNNPLENDLNNLRKDNINKARQQRLEELKKKHFGSHVVMAR